MELEQNQEYLDSNDTALPLSYHSCYVNFNTDNQLTKKKGMLQLYL